MRRAVGYCGIIHAAFSYVVLAIAYARQILPRGASSLVPLLVELESKFAGFSKRT